MNDILQTKIDRLNKSASNVSGAKNEAQRNAAEKFLVQRARELDEEKARLAQWLADADAYIEAHMPEINGDAGNEYNLEWMENHDDYKAVSDALANAWTAFMTAREAA